MSTVKLCSKPFIYYPQIIERKHRIVLVSGKFDPPHQGHIDHILKASKLAERILVVAQSDEGVISKKGKCYIPCWARMILLEGILYHYNLDGKVVEGVDPDGGSCNSLRLYRPNIFAKGGDRTIYNMPKDELELCKSLGIELVFGVGDLLNSSSSINEGM